MPGDAEGDDLAERVRLFIADQIREDPRKVALDSRLGDDLGIDGDTAVELFDAFADEFHVDLSAMEWGRHLGPEGCGSRGCAVALLALVAAAHAPWWLSGLLLAGGTSYLVAEAIGDPATQGLRPAQVPVRVQDMVDAARAGRWEMAYSDHHGTGAT